MKLIDLNYLIDDEKIVRTKIQDFKQKGIIRIAQKDAAEISGHLEKAEHNLRFIQDNLKLGYFDWCITGCYYAVYQAALALILAKGSYSKNHDATLCLLIKDYYMHGMNKEDIELINKFLLDYEELVFYVQSKNKREDATYSTNYRFDKPLVEELRLKAVLFVNKAKEIINPLN